MNKQNILFLLMLASCSNAFASANKRLAAQIFGGAAIAVVNAVIGYRDSSRGLKTGRLLASTASNLGAIALVQGLDMQSRYAIALYCIPTLLQVMPLHLHAGLEI